MMSDELKLNIGCGNDIKPDCTNIDKYNPNADIIAPADELDYQDSTVDEVYTSHMIEHLTPDELDSALKEWHRVLKPGGKLVIRCPNFELYIREWLAGDDDYREGWGLINIFGWQDRGPGLWHHSGFTVNRISLLLPRYGFMVQDCATTRTRQSKGEEYRTDGDIKCIAIKKA